MTAPLNPTQLTPPRVAFIDDRTGAISREWYRFFLSLLTATQTNQQDTDLSPDTSSLLASYDAVFTEAIEGLESAPDCCSETASLSAEVNDLAQTTNVVPPAVSFSAEIDNLAQTTGVTPPAVSFSAEINDLAQTTGVTPPAVSFAAEIDDLAQTTGIVPPAASESALATIQSQLEALALTPPPKEYRTLRYGLFYATNNQTATYINTAYAMWFNAPNISLGVTRGITSVTTFIQTESGDNIIAENGDNIILDMDSRIYVDRSNIYNIQFSANFLNTAAGARRVWIWLRKNGVDVADTATVVNIQGGYTETVAAWSFMLQMNSDDYFELMWEVNDVAVFLQVKPATGVHPVNPSITLTVTDNVSSLEV
jgi:hypothetical protein